MKLIGRIFVKIGFLGLAFSLLWFSGLGAGPSEDSYMLLLGTVPISLFFAFSGLLIWCVGKSRKHLA